MGYRSKHRLTVYGADDDTLLEIDADLEAGAETCDLFLGRDGCTYGPAGEHKWYDFDEDMRALASRFPGVGFVLERLGEDQMVPQVHEYGVTVGSREAIYARVADVLRRSGVEDAEMLIRRLEHERAVLAKARGET